MQAKRTLAFALGFVAPLLLVPSAHADTKVKDDAEDDAPARFDITRARYTYGDETVRLTGTIPELGDAGVAFLTISRFEIFEAGYVLRIRKKADEDPRVRLLYFDHFSLEPRECSGKAGTWGDGEITLRVSKDCLDGHARRRVYLQHSTGRGEARDEAPIARVRED